MKRFFDPATIILIILLVGMNFVNRGMSHPAEYFGQMLLLLPGIIIALSFHEFAHARISYKLGDPTPKQQGRVSLNPAAHIDPMGFIALMVAGFGWGKPVEIDPRYYRHPRRDELLVSVAGITMNLILAVVLAFILKMIPDPASASGVWLTILNDAMMINIVLAVFNLMPVPPLDGFEIVSLIFGFKNTEAYYNIYSKGFLILLVLLLTGVIDKILIPCVNVIYNMLYMRIIM